MSNPEIDSDGNKIWYNAKDELHREDGPAVEWANGDTCWFLNDKCHRLDGPALEYINGDKWFYIDDTLILEQDYPAAVLHYKCKQVLES